MKIFINENIINEAINPVDIKTAIISNKVARISYEGLSDSRLVEIDLIGRTKASNMAIRAFQISGSTKTENNNWKIFLVDKINSIELTDQDIADNRPNYNPSGDEEFVEIIYKRQ